MTNKQLSYYLGLRYDIVINVFEEDGVKEYTAYTRELNKKVFYGVGASIEEAIESFNELKADLFEEYLKRGLPIPEPEQDTDELPSGRFVMRMSPQMHNKLIKLAQHHKQSLNSYVNYILTQACTGHDVGLSLLKLEPRTNIVPIPAWRKDGLFSDVAEDPGIEYRTGKAV